MIVTHYILNKTLYNSVFFRYTLYEFVEDVMHIRNLSKVLKCKLGSLVQYLTRCNTKFYNFTGSSKDKALYT